MPCPDYKLTLTKKRFNAVTVQAIAAAAHLNGYHTGYNEAKKEFSAEAQKASYEAQARRETARLQVAHELIAAMRTIIDP